MAFWTQAGTEPKRNFRFRVTFDSLNTNNTELGGVLWWAKSVTTPSFDLGETEHHYLGGKYYFPGKVSWSEVNLALVDPISPDAVGLTNQLLTNSGYMVPDSTDTDQFSTISKNRSISAGLRGITIEVLQANGDVVETWVLQQPFIKAANFGDLDYSSEDLRTVELTIRYDWATCEFGPSHPDSATLGTVPYFEAGNTTIQAPNYQPNVDNSQGVNSDPVE
jgi:hypothetical protein